MFFIWSLWSSIISCKASVAQICFLFDLYDRQWSIAKARSPKYFLFGLYDRQWSHTKPLSPKIVLSLSLWSLMIFYKASDVQIWYYLISVIANGLLQSLGRPNMFFICFLWSKKPQLPKYVSYLDSMIVNDLFHNLGRPKSVTINDLLKSLGRPNMFFIWSL